MIDGSNEVTGFDKLVVCSGVTPSGNSVEAGLILPLVLNAYDF